MFCVVSVFSTKNVVVPLHPRSERTIAVGKDIIPHENLETMAAGVTLPSRVLKNISGMASSTRFHRN